MNLKLLNPVWKLSAAAAFFGATMFSARAGVMLDMFYQSGYPGGTAVTNLSQGTVLTSPDSVFAQTNGLQDFPASWYGGSAQNWGTWSRGFIEAPQTGQYTFWIASDDDSQLWLSTDATPTNRVLICQNVGAVPPLNFTAKPAQQSAPVSLVAGQKYYYEVYHTKGATPASSEHFEVAWQLPDSTYEPIINQKHLWAYPEGNLTGDPVATAPQILTTYQGYDVPTLPNPLTVNQSQPVDLTVTIEAYPPGDVQWYSNNVAIPGATLASYHIPAVSLGMNGATYSVIASNNLGTATASTTFSVTPDTTPPTLVDSLDLGNPAGDVAVVFSESVDPTTGLNPANYSIPGATVIGAHIGSTPDTVLLQVSGLTLGGTNAVIVNNVQDLAGNVIAANSSSALGNALAAWYQMDESSGTVAHDSSGNGLNGTMMNSVIPDYAGKIFRSERLINSATPGYVQLPSGFSNFSSNGLTVALWVYPTSEGAQANWDRFIDFGNNAASDNILFARSGISRAVNFSAYVGNIGNGVTSPDGILLMNQWQQYVATMDPSGNVILYRNGVQVATGNIPVPNVLTRTKNYIGLSNWGGDDHYDGRVDDVRIYNRVLSPAAVLALANGGGPDDSNPSIPTVNVVATTPNTTLAGGSPGVFTISRVGDTNANVTVNYTMSGTATNGGNYASLSGSVVIPAGTNSVQVLVSPVDFSFSDVSRSAILTITPDANYSLEDPNSDTVAIQNNDLLPSAIVASGDNPGGASSATTISVWFAAAVTAPTATNLVNYTLGNAPGVTLISGTLTNSGYQVVLNVSGTLPTGATLSVSGVQDASGHTSPSVVPIYLRQTPVNVVGNNYHQGRGNAYKWSSQVVMTPGAYWDTWNAGASPTCFVGMFYQATEDFHTIKVTLGNQYSDGGDWATQPNVYILKRPIDSNTTPPETDTNDWLQVPAKLISPNTFSSGINPASPNTPIVFDLSSVPDADRTGYGWAVGGVPGAGGNRFITVAQVFGYATQGTNLLVITQQPTNLTVTAGQLATITEQNYNGIGLYAPLNYQWLRSDDNGATFNSIAGATNDYYTLTPAMPTDNNAQFQVVISAWPNPYSVTSTPAILTVLNRTTPPVVVDATYDPANLLIDVWFDEPVDSGTATTLANYQINDGSVVLSMNGLDSYSRRVVLSLSAAPTNTSPAITVNNVMDLFGNTITTAQTASLLNLSGPAALVVANQYQQGRAAAFFRSTTGPVTHDANTTTWTTYGGNPGTSDFVGLTYAQPQAFSLLKVDLGWQFVNGGDWGYQPKVFILKNPVDSNQTAPENDPADWVQVPASLISGNPFQVVGPDGPANAAPINTPIAFDLSQLPLSQRTGYGWAVGGVIGNQLFDGQFLSIAKLRSFGTTAAAATGGSGAPTIAFNPTPQNQTLPAGFPLTYTVVASGAQPISYQWRANGVNLADNLRVSGSQSNVLNITGLASPDAGSYVCIASNSFGSVTSSPAMLAVSSVNTVGVSNYEAAVTAEPSLISFYSFNHFNANDDRGLHNGTLVGGTSGFTTGFAGDPALLLSGLGWDNLGNVTDFDFPSHIGTVELWFRADWTTPPGIDPVFFSDRDSGNGVNYSFHLNGPNKNYIGMWNGTAYQTIPCPAAGTTWHHLAVIFNGTVCTLVMDGQNLGNLNQVNTGNSLTCQIGSSSPQGREEWIGGLDEVAYYSTALTPADVASHYQAYLNSIQPVSLNIAASGGNVLVSWPTGTGMTLQQTTNLTSSVWTTVTNAVNVVGGQNQVQMPASAAATEFYRLVR